jgi:radical SAM/Cys-rich protein
MSSFDQKLAQHGLVLRRAGLKTLQVNIGRKCNQACRHCHVDAGPWRTEMLDQATFTRIAEWIQRHRPEVVDITGGAPELHEFFCPLVEVSRSAGCQVMDRNNLTIIEEPGFGWLPEYLALHEVEVVASLPCYTAGNVSRQRGAGVFEKSITALKKLNAVGYGTRLPLNLVYNPVGPSLPGPQAELETDYRQELERSFGIVFSRLFTIINQPIARFAEDLHKSGQWDAYLELLANSFNAATVDDLMCRTTLSVGHRGEVHDCDFNQMLGLPLGVEKSASTRKPVFLWEVSPETLAESPIRTGLHCFACTAGSGSSCTGALG